ncbi:hypothetical protein B7494_g2185 [Chlorociboria aeruginascens]|nr:hypothetical protein B7494_g2185 [Chlorociboria aeruginascens]
MTDGAGRSGPRKLEFRFAVRVAKPSTKITERHDPRPRARPSKQKSRAQTEPRQSPEPTIPIHIHQAPGARAGGGGGGDGGAAAAADLEPETTHHLRGEQGYHHTAYEVGTLA